MNALNSHLREIKMSLLARMQETVDLLWQQVIYSKTDEEREKNRRDYFRALDIYKRQCLLHEGIEHSDLPNQNDLPNTDQTSNGVEDGTPSEEQAVRSPSPRNLVNGPNPFEYSDYISYVLGWLNFHKQKSPDILLDFTRVTGISPDSMLKAYRRALKIQAKDHTKILKYLNLPSLESAFIDVLYLLSETDSPVERSKAMQQLTRFSPFKKKNPEGYEVWRYLSHWYYPAIREMATLPGFKADPFWIQSRLVRFVPISEIRKCLQFLKGAHFFRVDDDGKVITHHKHINCVGGLYRLALRNFHKEMLEVATSSITSLTSDKRLLLAHTVAVPESKKDLLFRILAETIEKVQALGAGENEEDDIYHVELVAMPLTQKASAD